MKRARFKIPDKSPGRPTVPMVLPILRKYLAMPGNEVGGSLHIITDDGNIGDGHLEWVALHADRIGDYRALAIVGLMQMMTKTQRRKLIALA